jgi:hypothetical protein
MLNTMQLHGTVSVDYNGQDPVAWFEVTTNFKTAKIEFQAFDNLAPGHVFGTVTLTDSTAECKIHQHFGQIHNDVFTHAIDNKLYFKNLDNLRRNVQIQWVALVQ